MLRVERGDPRGSGRLAPGTIRERRGVSLIEIAVAVVVIVLLSAAVSPSVVRTLDRERVETTIYELFKIADGLHTMRTDNQDWPERLTHMSAPINTSQRNICGDLYNNGRVNNWEGPYLDRVVPAGGLPIGIGVAQDSMIRNPPLATGRAGSAHADMIIVIDSVTEEDAIELNRKLDGDGSATAGAVRWTVVNATTGMTKVQYVRPIKGC